MCRDIFSAGGRRFAALALLVVAVLGACADRPEVQMESVTLTAEPEANDNTPVAVDLVLVRDVKLVEELAKIEANAWFQRKAQYLRDYTGGGVSVFSWEIVPGQTLNSPIQGEASAWAGVLYANYSTPGAHRTVARAKTLRVRLGRDEMVVLP